MEEGRPREVRRSDTALEEMVGAGLVHETHISGVEEGGVSFDEASIRDLQNYMDNQQKSGKIKLVYDRLLENMRR